MKYKHRILEEGEDGIKFMVKGPKSSLQVIASWGDGWYHVSVSLPHRTPSWQEMNFIKQITFGPDTEAFQLHPKKEHYINVHPYCLHLWRPMNEKIPLPPQYMV